MPRSILDYSVTRDMASFDAPTGFRLTCGICAMDTSRGESRPGARAARLGLLHEMHSRRLGAHAVEFWQSLRNLRAEAVNVTEIRTFDGVIEMEGAGWRVAHMELFKRDRYFGGFNAYTEGLLAPLPGTEGEFGLAEDLPFPGIFFTHPERGTVLMAVLSQERCKPLWRLSRRGATTTLTAMDYFSGIPHLRVKEGEELATERWVALWTRGGMEAALEEYYRLLRKRMRFPGEHSPLREAIVWGSWNYNYRPRGHMDITHKSILANARALVKMVPNKPRFVMIDDGYQHGSSAGRTKGWFASFMEILHDYDTPHDPALFPEGMQGVARGIRKAGASPALWLTPRLHRDSALAKARSEWLLPLAGGRSFGPRSAYLDYSIPEARDYIRNAWRTVFSEWGFQAVKLDFWTIPFEVPFVRFRHRDRTAIELRNLFLQDLRDAVPQASYILTGVAVSGGNPFTGRYIDAARCGQDIGDGEWSLVRESASYLSVVPSFYRHDCLLADPDSIGWCPRITPAENRLWATMGLMTGGMCEIGGDLPTLAPEARALLEKVIGFFAPARRTTGVLDGCGLNGVPAPMLRLERDDGIYEACMNWTNYPREVRLPGRVRDLWSGQALSGTHMIPPHDVVWFRR